MIAVDNFHAILRGISIDHVIRLGIGIGIDHDQVTRPETYIRTNKFIILYFKRQFKLCWYIINQSKHSTVRRLKSGMSDSQQHPLSDQN